MGCQICSSFCRGPPRPVRCPRACTRCFCSRGSESLQPAGISPGKQRRASLVQLLTSPKLLNFSFSNSNAEYNFFLILVFFNAMIGISLMININMHNQNVSVCSRSAALSCEGFRRLLSSLMINKHRKHNGVVVVPLSIPFKNRKKKKKERVQCSASLFKQTHEKTAATGNTLSLALRANSG